MTNAAATAGLGRDSIVGVVGAGAMGAGIAQVAAAAGHRVLMFDALEGAAARGRARIRAGLEGLVGRGRLAREDADSLLERIVVAETLEALSGAALVIEAIVEALEIKRDLIGRLEAIVTPAAILATNTSSISVTAIARGAQRPERIVGMHFFNPAPIMKLVEIVSGVATAPVIAERVFATAEAWGKVAVHARSTPGFIVNRVARAYYAEPLRLYEEQVATPTTIDALMTEGAGFRMGPFALMDLIGHDVNYAVSTSIFDAYYQEPRFRPSVAQRELVDAGRLGQKSGRGVYDYAEGAAGEAPSTEPVCADAALIDEFALGGDRLVDGVRIALTDGRTAGKAALGGTPTIFHDLSAAEGATRLGFAASPDVPRSVIDRFVATLAAQGRMATRLPDWPGLVAMRTVAMLANEGFEAVLQGVATEDGVDSAMRFGVNYPRGPIDWARHIGLPHVLGVIDNLHDQIRDPRYRASLGLRMAASATLQDLQA
ncbi:MAG: 3-hydroxybutyryl-CoA dehydrogenase [Mucilaginibacter sp.]|nr:3-hydroxybutyryl-CoA dehydrogenase [Mucilaginibacter sp.]